MFTKESAILFPLLALFYSFVFKKEKIFSLPLLLLLAGWGIILANWQIVRSASMVVPVGNKLQAAATVLSNLWLAFFYLGKIFWPWKLAFAPVAADAHPAAGIIAAVFLVVILLLSERRDWKMLLFGALWFLFFFLPTFYYDCAVHTPPKFYEHRLYTPFLGILFLLLSLSFSRFARSFKRILPVLTFLVIGVLGWMSYVHTNDFRNSLTLGEYDAATSPNDPRQYRDMTRMNVPARLVTEIQLLQGSTRNPGSSLKDITKEELWNTIDDLNKKLHADPGDAEIPHALAVAYFARGLFLSSEENFLTAGRRTPHNAVIPYNLGILYYSAHAEIQAEHAWQEALQLDPSMGSAHLNLSYLLYETGRYQPAWEHCQRALQLGIPVPPSLVNDIRRKIS